MVPNLYPALAPAGGGRAGGGGTHDAGEVEPVTTAPGALASGDPERQEGPRGAALAELFTSLPATGAHEVIVNGPQPVLSLAELPVEQVAAAMDVWRERMRATSTARTCS